MLSFAKFPSTFNFLVFGPVPLRIAFSRTTELCRKMLAYFRNFDSEQE